MSDAEHATPRAERWATSTATAAPGGVGDRLVALANEAASANGGRRSAGVLDDLLIAAGLAGLLGSPPDGGTVPPAEVFNAFAYPGREAARRRLERVFLVVAAPGTRLVDAQLRPGDVLVRSAWGEGPGHLAILHTGDCRRHDQLAAAGLRPEGPRRGLYAWVVEGGPWPHAAHHGFARLVADPAGWVPRNQLVLRLRPEALGEQIVGGGLAAETPAVAAGREVLDRVPLLRTHRGTPPDLILRWNDMQALPEAVDVVVHFHGFSGRLERMSIRDDKEPYSGLDFVDPDAPSVAGRTRPTLALLPRGDYAGRDPGRRVDSYAFPALVTVTGLTDLIAFALRHFGAAIGVPQIQRARLILTAHSGGGAALTRVVLRANPDEVEIFDALYTPATNLINWATARIAQDVAALQTPMSLTPREFMAQRGGSLRVLHRAGTEDESLAVHHALCAAIPAAPNGGSVVRDWYRVERTTIEHGEIPRVYGWRLLADASAALPHTRSHPCDPGAASGSGQRTHARPAESVPVLPARAPEQDVPPFGGATVQDHTSWSVGAAEDYAPQGVRRYTPVAAAFRCAPNPATVDPATFLPAPTADPDNAARTAMQALGVGAAVLRRFESRGGFEGVRTIAGMFGAEALRELLQRLRYSADRLVEPPHTYDSEAEARRRLSVRTTAMLLAPRLLLAIPAHMRELARRAPTAEEAFALENLGWLLMQSVRDEIASVSGIRWWIPDAPPFVTPFANPLPMLSQEVQGLIVRTMLIDTTLSINDFNARCEAWKSGLAGRAWRLETGMEAAPEGSGLPFYARLVAIPPAVDITPQRQQVEAIWQQRLAAADARFPDDEQARTHALTECDESWLASLHLLQPVSLQGLQLVGQFPARSGAHPHNALTVLGAIQPTLALLFRTARELGWNDLLFQTAGAICFRGVKLPPSNTHRHAAARRMSNHSLGIAIDFNHFENVQPAHASSQAAGSMDPRIVALFEAFHFRWGRCFPTPDPMHFEYCGIHC